MTHFSQRNASLHTIFMQNLNAINSEIGIATLDIWWQDIAKRYSEPVRAYHTLVHLQQLFDQFEQLQVKLEQQPIVALALFYHDVIYDPKRGDNELKSAEYASEVLSEYLSVKQVERIYTLILMTADHQLHDVDNDNTNDSDSDAAYLLDMDLSVLGSSWSDYERYAKAVRHEYAHVAEMDYRLGRTNVLQGLLAHPRLYVTDYYYQRLETQARENIEREIIARAT